MDVDVKLTEDNDNVPPVKVQTDVICPQTAAQEQNLGQLLSEAGGSQQENMQTGSEDGQATLQHANAATSGGEGGSRTSVGEETSCAKIVHMPVLNSAPQSKTTTPPPNFSDVLALLQSQKQGVNQTPEGQASTQHLTQQNVTQPTVIFGTRVNIGGQQFLILSNPPKQGSHVILSQPSAPQGPGTGQTNTQICIVSPTQTSAKDQTSTGSSHVPSPNTILTPQVSTSTTSFSHTYSKTPRPKLKLLPPKMKPKEQMKPKEPKVPKRFPYCSALGLDLSKRSHVEGKRDLKLLSNAVAREVYNFANKTNQYFGLVVFDVLEKHFDLSDVGENQRCKFSQNVVSKLTEMGKKWRQMDIHDRSQVFTLPEIPSQKFHRPITGEEIEAMAKNCVKYNLNPAMPMNKRKAKLREWLKRKRNYENLRFVLNEKAGNETFCRSLQNMRSLLDAWVYPDGRGSPPSISDAATTLSTLRPVETATLSQNAGPVDFARNVVSGGSGLQPLSLGPVEKEASSKVTGITQCPVDPDTSLKNAGFTDVDERMEAATQSTLAEPVKMEIDPLEDTLHPTGAEERVVVNNELTDDCIKEEPVVYPICPGQNMAESDYQTDDTWSNDDMDTSAHSDIRPSMSELDRTVDNPYPICRKLGINLDGRPNSRLEKDKLPVGMLINALMIEIHDYANQICSSSMQVFSTVIKHYFNLDSQSEQSLQSEDFLNRLKQLFTRLRTMKHKQHLLEQTFSFAGEKETRKYTKVKKARGNEGTDMAVLSPKYQRLKEISEKRRLAVQKNKEMRASQALERTVKSQKTKVARTDQKQPRSPLPLNQALESTMKSQKTKAPQTDQPPYIPHPTRLSAPQSMPRTSQQPYIPHPLRISAPQSAGPQLASENPAINIRIKEEQEEVMTTESLYPHYPGSSQGVVPVTSVTQLVDENPTVKIPKKEEQEELSVESCPVSNQRAVPVTNETQLVYEKPIINLPKIRYSVSTQRVIPVTTTHLVKRKATVLIEKIHYTKLGAEKPTIKICIKEEQEETSTESSCPHSPGSSQRADPVTSTEFVDEKPTIKIPKKEEQEELSVDSCPVSNQRAVPVNNTTQLVDEKPTICIKSVESLYPHCLLSNRRALADEKPAICIKSVESLYPHCAVSNQRAVPVNNTTQLADEKPTIRIPKKEEYVESSMESFYPHCSESKQSAVSVNVAERVEGVRMKEEHKETSTDPFTDLSPLPPGDPLSLYSHNSPVILSVESVAPDRNFTQILSEVDTVEVTHDPTEINPVEVTLDPTGEEERVPVVKNELIANCIKKEPAFYSMYPGQNVTESHRETDETCSNEDTSTPAESINEKPTVDVNETEEPEYIDLSQPSPGDPTFPYSHDSADNQVPTYTKMVLDVVLGGKSEKRCPIFTKLATCVGHPAAPDRSFKQILSDYSRDVVPHMDEYVYTDFEREKLSVVNELFCGIRLIEGLAYQMEMTLLLWEKMIFEEEAHGSSNTRRVELESRTARLVKTVSNAVCPERGATKEGTFQKFKAFLMSTGEFSEVPLVPLGGGTRVAAVCHNAAGVYSMHNDLVEFTNNYSKDSSLCERITADLEVQHLKAGCRALGLVSTFILDPLWKALTRKGNAWKMVPRYLILISKLKEWQNDGRLVVEGNACLFADIEIPKDLLFDKLTTWTDSDFFELTVQIVELLLASLWTICSKMPLTYPGLFKPALTSEELRQNVKFMSEKCASLQMDISTLGRLGSEEIGAIYVALETMINSKKIRRAGWLQKRASLLK